LFETIPGITTLWHVDRGTLVGIIVAALGG
jgi:hypothetical protein